MVAFPAASRDDEKLAVEGECADAVAGPILGNSD